MEKSNEELNGLLRAVDENLASIQQNFDNYQNKNFQKRPPEFFCLELNGEAGELANLEKKMWKGIEIDPASVSDEAADVFIALLNYTNSRGIDLAAAVARKLLEIEKRRADTLNF